MNSSGLGLRQVACCWEHCDVLPGFTKYEEYLTSWGTVSFSRTTLYHAVKRYHSAAKSDTVLPTETLTFMAAILCLCL